jgi:hypothetical protein
MEWTLDVKDEAGEGVRLFHRTRKEAEASAWTPASVTLALKE